MFDMKPEILGEDNIFNPQRICSSNCLGKKYLPPVALSDVRSWNIQKKSTLQI